jgi:TatD DNase family protein
MLVDTHCHIHEAIFLPNGEDAVTHAISNGVTKMICVGTSELSSFEAVDFAASRDGIFASVGVHPHDSKDGYSKVVDLAAKPKVVAIGEIGLDYHYTNSPKEVQIEALEVQIKLALDHDLPIIFHVRDAFDDFWPIFDKYPGIRGELHSFTDSKENLQKALERGLYIGVNGISTFTKDDTQKDMYDMIPLDHLLLETDAPFLTPHPFRGKVNEPAMVKVIAEYHAQRRGISIDDIANATSENARALFAL